MEDFLNASPDFRQKYIEHLVMNAKTEQMLGMHGAAASEGRQHQHRDNEQAAKAKHRDKVASSYNLMALIAGGPVITSRDEIIS